MVSRSWWDHPSLTPRGQPTREQHGYPSGVAAAFFRACSGVPGCPLMEQMDPSTQSASRDQSQDRSQLGQLKGNEQGSHVMTRG